MALDVGVVQIDYSIGRPPKWAAYQYAWELMAYDGDDCWKISSGTSVFMEMGYETVANHAMGYIESNGLTSTEAHQVMRWIRSLPWQNGPVMLHMGW